jgi:DNA-binding transcriptional ArsR family regulator
MDWLSATWEVSLEISPSTLSHHLEKLKHEDLVSVRRDGTYLWYFR